MPIDAYSPCPGGKNKKIKFCCPKLVGELQKIGRMLEGEQYQACLRHIERLEDEHPGEACLLSTKTMLLRVLGRTDEAQTAAAEFLEKHPDNPVALAETAMVKAMAQDGLEAVEPLVRAIELCGTEMHRRVYEAMGIVSQVLAAEGEIFPARTLATLQLRIQQDDRRALSLLMQFNLAPGIPLAIKDDRPLEPCPDDVPWKAAFDEAVSLADRAHWLQAAKRLTELSRQAADAPAVWRNLATVRCWLGDHRGAIEALGRFASLQVPLEDAVEAEALARFLSDDPLGDQIDMFTLKYAVQDVEHVQASLGSAAQVGQVPIDPASMAEDDEPPPKAAFVIFDRRPPDSLTDVSWEALPRVLCEALLFGKQTDREARLEIEGVAAPDVEPLKTVLADLVGQQLGPDPQPEQSGQVSASHEMLDRRWYLPEGMSREDFQRIVDQYLDTALLETWPRSPLALLDGKSPGEVADQQSYRVRLLAAVMVLEHWLATAGSRFDGNRLRSHLGLPTLEPVELDGRDLNDLPLVRLSRVVVEKLSDDAVLDGFRRARAYGVRPALQKFGRAVADRASLANRRERFQALALLARVADDPDEALQYVEQGRKAADAAGQSNASWDLLELELRFRRRQGAEASRLIQHLDGRHIQEPGIAQALTEMLVEVGLLRPDGTPAVPMEPAERAEPSLIVPGQPGAEPGGLWTPDSQKPPGEKPKLWTPGMD